MNYFENRLFNIGFILVFIGGILTSFSAGNQTAQVIAGVLAIIGLIILFYGVYQENREVKS